MATSRLRTPNAEAERSSTLGAASPKCAFSSRSVISSSPIKARNDMRILVVDDDATLQRTYNRVLAIARFNVTVARSADDALRILREDPEVKFDVIVTDFHMPGMDGLEFIRKLNAEHRDRFGSAILVSGEANDEDRIAVIKAGGKTTLKKPVGVFELVATIDLVGAYTLNNLAVVLELISEIAKGYEMVTIPETAMRACIEAIIRACNDVICMEDRRGSIIIDARVAIQNALDRTKSQG